MSLRFRILVSIFALILLFAVMTGVSLISSSRMLSWENEIYSVRLISIDKLIEADRDAYQSHLAMTYLMWGSTAGSLTAEVIDGLKADIRDNRDQVGERFGVFDELSTEVSQDAQTAKTEFGVQFSAWSTMTDNILSSFESDSIQTAMGIFVQDYNSTFDAMRNTLDVLTEFSLAEAEARHIDVQRTGGLVLTANIIMALVGAAIGIFIVIFVNKKAIQPILRVASQVEDLSSGNGDLTFRLPVAGNDEIAKLSGHLNSFIAKTEEILIGLHRATEEAQSVKSGIISSVEENSGAATEISANVDSISQRITKQDDSIQNISSNLDSMKSSIGVFESQVADQAAMVEESTASVTQMIASIQNLANIAQSRKEATDILKKTVNEGDSQVKESNEAVQAIHGDIDAILEMTKLIAGIAAQTNLLAMNAAIEAAHAGEAGRGFAVVADEIRKLAESSSSQSSSINEVLKRVVDNIETASESSGHTSATYQEVLREFENLSSSFDEITSSTLELDTGGKQILEAMNHLNDHSQSVRDEAATIQESNQEVSKSMTNIADMSVSVNQASTEINTGMQEISTSLELMRGLAHKLQDSMNQAAEFIGLFKLSS